MVKKEKREKEGNPKHNGDQDPVFSPPMPMVDEPVGSPEDVFARHFRFPGSGIGPAEEFLKPGKDELSLLIRSRTKEDQRGPKLLMYIEGLLSSRPEMTKQEFVIAFLNYEAALSISIDGQAREEFGRGISGWWNRPDKGRRLTKRQFGEQTDENYPT